MGMRRDPNAPRKGLSRKTRLAPGPGRGLNRPETALEASGQTSTGPRTPKRRRVKSERKRLVEALHKAFSLFIRARDIAKYGNNCPLCIPCRGLSQSEPIANAFHWVSRQRHILAWDPINATGSCWPCNSVFSGKWGGGNQAPFWRWYIKEYGQEQFERLEEKSHQQAKFSNADLEQKLSELAGGSAA